MTRNNIHQSSAIAVTALVATAASVSISYWWYGKARSSRTASSNIKQITNSENKKSASKVVTRSQSARPSNQLKVQAIKATVASDGTDASIKSRSSKNAISPRRHQSPTKPMVVKAKTVPKSMATTTSKKHFDKLPLSSIIVQNSNKDNIRNLKPTTAKASKSIQKPQRRIRVRDSLLPEDLRRNIQAFRKQAETEAAVLSNIDEENNVAAATQAPTPPNTTTTTAPTTPPNILQRCARQQRKRRQKIIRVRDSLLPMSIRQQKRKEEELESLRHQRQGAVAQCQTTLMSPPTTKATNAIFVSSAMALKPVYKLQEQPARAAVSSSTSVCSSASVGSVSAASAVVSSSTIKAPKSPCNTPQQRATTQQGQRKVPKKLSPTRRNLFDGKGTVVLPPPAVSKRLIET